MEVTDIKEKLSDTSEGGEINVLLIGIYPDTSEEKQCDVSLAELKQLAETSIGEGSARSKFFSITQCRKAPDSATFIGQGKAEEAAKLCFDNDISLAVMDAEMSPSQIRNLEDILNKYYDASSEKHVRVIDRTMLILDIFAKHAVTGEGKLQVEIAQLRYTSPRLTGKGLQLSRQGGTSGSIGARGPGETKLETDKRHLQRRIQSLRSELEELEKERLVKRGKRQKSGIPTAAIAGYTNAGKSTLLNYLTNAGILAENKLFATLDPTVRSLTLPSGREILLSDTVGFINKLPHGLIEAFKSTLDEVRFADIILVIIDASDPEAERKTAVTEEILNDLSASGKPTVYVFNKSDMIDVIPPADVAEAKDAVYISAKTGEGVEKLLEKLDRILADSKIKAKFVFPFDNQSAVSYLYKNTSVESVEYTESGVEVVALVTAKETGMFSDYLAEDI